MDRKITTQLVVMTHIPGVYDSTTSAPADWFLEYIGGGNRSESGIAITADKALSFAPWFQGVSIISGDVARVSLDIYERKTDDDRRKRRDHEAYGLLNMRANRYMSSFSLRETMQAHALTWGNGYAAIIRAGITAEELIPIMPDQIWPERDASGRVNYVFRATDGTERIYHTDDILHVKGLGWDGLSGYSVFSYAKNSLGLGLAAEQHGARHFRNDARPSVVLRYPGRLDKPDADMLLNQWEDRHGANPSRPALATGGLDVVPLSMSNEDSQFIETRKFQRDEIASWLGLPPHKLGSDSRLSYNSVEAEERAYVSQTLMRWFARWEAECQMKLLRAVEQKRWWYCEHNTGALIQGDFSTQADVATKLRAAKIITQNEARKTFNLNTVDGGDTFENPNTTTEQKTAVRADRQDVAIEAHRELIVDRMRQLVRSERAAIVRLAGSRAPVRAMENFYAQFSTKVTAALDACIRAYAALSDTGAVSAADVATWYCDQSMRLIVSTLSAVEQDCAAAALEAATADWEDKRPPEVVHMITGGL
jgi:HK97 family phage portal protein